MIIEIPDELKEEWDALIDLILSALPPDSELTTTELELINIIRKTGGTL